ncbi:hypothetical protein ACFQ60_22390 [Streptomyces zhihengii]
MPNIEEILKRAKPRQKSVWICVAGDLLSEVDRLERELREVGEGWSPDSLASCDPREKIAKRIKTVREAMKKAEVEFVFRSIGDRAWSDLVAAHPPKKQGPAGSSSHGIRTRSPGPGVRQRGGPGHDPGAARRAVRGPQRGPAQ